MSRNAALIKRIVAAYPELPADDVRLYLADKSWMELVFMCDAIDAKKFLAEHRRTCPMCIAQHAQEPSTAPAAQKPSPSDPETQVGGQ